jgi:hypothetical protein
MTATPKLGLVCISELLKDKNKKTVYSGKHVRKQMEIQNKTNKNAK